MFQIRVVEKIKTHILYSITFFQLYEIKVEKHCRAGWATDDNMVHVHCMLDTKGYRHTLIIFNTYCFHMATMVAQMPFNVMFYIHCLSCKI